MVLSVGHTVRYICDIYAKHGKPGVSKNMTPNRAAVKKPGYLVHAIKLVGNPLVGVLNEFTPDGKTFIMTIQTGDPAKPFRDAYPIQAIWAKRTWNQEYTFMGVFERNPKSTEAKRIYDRIKDTYDPAIPDWEIIGFV
ncbi:hypothetical protein AGMMS50255_3380 [Spirochaetia bacterium]|nr:hypothetical protein AGMMS50255_3380 [Spirochaetia bacterium]